MKIKHLIFYINMLLLPLFLQAQSSVNDILKSISNNNNELKTQRQYFDAQKLGLKTDLLPDNPEIAYGHFPGRNGTTGVKKVVSVSQSFDFPMVYVKKHQQANLEAQSMDLNFSLYRQSVLSEAKQLVYELVYLQKMNQILNQRVIGTQKLNDSYKAKLRLGDATVLDANKAGLQLLDLKNQLRMNETLIGQYTEKLVQLNGGNQIVTSGLQYDEPDISHFDTIKAEMLKISPVIKLAESEGRSAANRLKLSKQEWMPGFVVGYETEMVPNEAFGGVKFGMEIPLWKNTNKLKFAKAASQTTEYNLVSKKLKLVSELRQHYQKTVALQISLTEYNQSLNNLNSLQLLHKSLEAGQISSIEYFMETTWFYQVYDNFMQIEKEYFQALAKLYEYRL